MISKQTDDVAGAARPVEDALPPEDPEELALIPQAWRTPDDGDAAPVADAPSAAAPPEVAELSAACARFVASRYGAELDFAPETLSFVDHWVREARVESARRPELVEVIQAAAGAYLGEVIRRAFGGAWSVGGHHADWRLQLDRVFCSFNPIGMAREALFLEAAEGWGGHLVLDPAEAEAIDQRLAALPPARDEEFYAPSTRFDVVHIVFEALLDAQRSRGLSDVRFGPEDYPA